MNSITDADWTVPANAVRRPIVVLERPFRWHVHQHGQMSVWFAGEREIVERLMALIVRRGTLDVQEITSHLRQERGHFGMIMATPGYVLAAVDRVRSWPIYYTTAPFVLVGNSARRLLAEANAQTVDDAAVTEFVMTGYVTGSGTLFRSLKQMQAGELLIVAPAAGGRPETSRYYRYLPRPTNGMTLEDGIADFGAVVDRVFRRVADKANGRPIWVPLSGGYDSRLVFCKLHEIGYPNLTAFSYGPRFNHDAKVARHVATTLGAEWIWVPSLAADARRVFNEPQRRAYWDYADGLSIIPSMREYQALVALTRGGVMPDDAILINGQTGDYLSGGHIPPRLYSPASIDGGDLLEAVVAKHWSLWENWKTAAGRALAHRRIKDELPRHDLEGLARQDLIALYEAWEGQERQSKFVINGQRMYEFFDRDWQLPHWDGEFLDFWETVPVDLKYQQNLYKAFLKRWNYGELFRNFDPFVWRWPVHMMWVLGLAKLVGMAAGGPAKDRLYKLLWYFSHYNNIYAAYGLRHYLRTSRIARSPISLQVETWLRENCILSDLRNVRIPA